MSGSIVAFEQIAESIRVPGSYVEIRPIFRNTGIAEWPARVLLIGQRLSGAAAAVNRLYQITRNDQADALFGAGSILAAMCRAFRAANPITPLFAIAVADPSGGTAATGTYTFSGTPAAAGQVAAYPGGDRIVIPVATTDTPTTLANRLRDAINARTDLPVTALASAGAVNLTFRHAGSVGNDYPLKRQILTEDLTPPGLTFGVTDMANGAGESSLAPALSAIAAEWFTDIVIPYTDSTTLAALEAELVRRYAAGATLDAHAYVGRGGTFSGLGSFGGARNSQHLSCLGMGGIVTSPWRIAAALAGVAAFQTTNDPARQLRGLALPGVRAPATDARFTDAERDLLLRDGISTYGALQDGTVVIERLITMYQQTSLGIADTAWLDITTPKTLSRIRYDWRAYLSRAYPRHKLADDGAIAAQFDDAVVTPRILQGAWAGRLKLYEQRGWVEDAAGYAAQAVFVRDATDRNRVNARLPIRLLGNLIVMASALEFEV